MLPDQALQDLVRSGADDVRCGALETLGNLAFCRANRPTLLAAEGLRDWLARLAQDKVAPHAEGNTLKRKAFTTGPQLLHSVLPLAHPTSCSTSSSC